MSHSGAGLKTIVDNGRERRTDGLLKHLGLIDAGSVRAVDNQTYGARSGAGLELLYDKGSLTSFLQSFDRDANQYRDLSINARNINVIPQGGKVSLPSGTAQALVGSYFSNSAFSLAASGTWTETDVRANCTLTGAPLRIEWSAPLVGSASAGAGTYIGVGMDGGVQWNVAHWINSAAGYSNTLSGTLYHMTPPTGAHRVSLFVYGTSGAAFLSSVLASLWLTEMRA